MGYTVRYKTVKCKAFEAMGLIWGEAGVELFILRIPSDHVYGVWSNTPTQA